MSFSARVTDDPTYYGATISNTAYFSSPQFSGVSNKALTNVAPVIRINSPYNGQTIVAPDGISVTLTVAIAAPYHTLPDDGYWQLWVDNAQALDAIQTYTATTNLLLGAHVISATLRATDHQLLGVSDPVYVTVVKPFGHNIYLPIIFKAFSH